LSGEYNKQTKKRVGPLNPQFPTTDAKRQHLSTINTNNDLSFGKIQKQTYRRKQSMDQSDGKVAHGTTDEKRASKIPRGRKYMHRKASRKTHSTNGVNIEY